MSELADLITVVETHQVDDHIGHHGWEKVAKKLLKWLYYYIARCDLWKRKAKKWRKRALYARDDLTVAKSMFDFEETVRHDTEATAYRLRGLLRRWNDKRVQETHEDCYFCGASIQVETTPPPKTKIVFTDNHAANCELARELEND